MRTLLFLTHFAMLLFSAYFWHNFGVHWLQVSDYDLTLNDQVAKNLTHSIDILDLLPLPVLAISFLLFFNVFIAALRCCYGLTKLEEYSGNIYLI